MPGVNGPSGDFLVSQLNAIQSQLTSLSQQSQYVVVDQNLALRVQLGLLSNGDFGVLLVDALGNQQELLPAVSEFGNGGTTTSTTPVTISGTPAFDADLGASGDFEVTCSSQLANGGLNSAVVWLLVDGTAVGTLLDLGVSTNVAVTAACAKTVRWTQWSTANPTGAPLSPGSHSFALQVQATLGVLSNFSSVYLKVQPL